MSWTSRATGRSDSLAVVRHHGAREIRPGLSLPDEAIIEFAERHGVRRLALFGSALRPDFSDDSDVDLLVEFQVGRTPGLLGMSAMELELEQLLGRPVDLRTSGDLSRYFRLHVVAAARELSAA